MRLLCPKKCFLEEVAMRLKNNVFICFIMGIWLLTFLHGTDKNTCDSQYHTKDATTKAYTIRCALESLTNAYKKCTKKNLILSKIKCKNCTTKILSYAEFEGGLIGLGLKYIADESDNFSKIKLLLDKCVEFLLKDASSSELINFMLQTSNDIQQKCSHCQGVSWEKID